MHFEIYSGRRRRDAEEMLSSLVKPVHGRPLSPVCLLTLITVGPASCRAWKEM